MPNAVMTLEMRWFFYQPLPAGIREWFETGLPGALVDVQKRADLYLVVTGRDDLGLKLREGKLELKWRSEAQPFASTDGQIRGVGELWDKRSWVYAPSLAKDVEAGFAEVGLAGPRLDVAKLRRQRKYEVRGGGDFVPIPSKTRVDRAALIELTDLEVDARAAWTLGLDAVGPRADVGRILAQAIDYLLQAFPASEMLSADRSFGYPRWLGAQVGA